MLLDGNPNDEAKAKEWVRQQKNAALRKKYAFKVMDGKLYHGYNTTTQEINAGLANIAQRRDLNSGSKYAEIAPMAGFSAFAIRQYAARIGVPTARMYREPDLMKRMIKDPDYSKFRLNDRAAQML